MAGGTMITNMSKAFQDEAARISLGMSDAKPNSNVFSISATLTSKLDQQFEVKYSPEIKGIRITQDFINNFTDKIIVYLSVLVKDAIAIYRHRNDLFCELDFTQVYSKKSPDYSIQPMHRKQYRAFLLDQIDVFKTMTDAEVHSKDGRPEQDFQYKSLDLRLELISDTIYNARKKRLNEVMRDVDMMSVLRYCVNKFGFTKAHIAMPDNRTPYINFMIPPGTEIRDIMSYLQNGDGYGVYSDGFCSYITSDDTWFIFPRFGTPLAKKVINVMSLGGTNYEGLEKYDWTEGEVRHLLINGDVSEKNWDSLGSENGYNAANILMSGNHIDGSKSVTADGECSLVPQVVTKCAPNQDAISSDEPVNIEHVHSRGNVFKILSAIGSYRVTTLDFTWKMATPFFFYPRCLVNFIYDSSTGPKTLPCVTERVETMFKRVGGRLYPTFIGTAQVTLMAKNISRPK